MEAQRAKSAGWKFGTRRFYSNFWRFWTDGLIFLAEVMLRKDARRSFDSKATKHSEIAFHGSNELSTSQKLMLSFPVKRIKSARTNPLSWTNVYWSSMDVPPFCISRPCTASPFKNWEQCNLSPERVSGCFITSDWTLPSWRVREIYLEESGRNFPTHQIYTISIL